MIPPDPPALALPRYRLHPCRRPGGRGHVQYFDDRRHATPARMFRSSPSTDRAVPARVPSAWPWRSVWAGIFSTVARCIACWRYAALSREWRWGTASGGRLTGRDWIDGRVRPVTRPMRTALAGRRRPGISAPRRPATAASQVATLPDGAALRCWTGSAAIASHPAWSRTGATWARWFSRMPMLKIFLTASPEERAERRYKQLKDNG